MQVLAIFGPTAVGKTGVAIAVAERLRAATGGYGSWPSCSSSLGLPQ